MPAGPLKVTLSPALTSLGPVMEHVGNGLTVSTTSSVLVHPDASLTLRRNVAVAVAPVTTTVEVKEWGELMLAGPERTVQFVELSGLTPPWAMPCKVKEVVGPVVHLAWSGPASAI